MRSLGSSTTMMYLRRIGMAKKPKKVKPKDGCINEELHERRQCLCYKSVSKSPDFRDKR